MDEGFRLKGPGKTEMPPKPGIHTRPGLLHPRHARLRPGHGSGRPEVGQRLSRPTPAKGLPYITGLLVLNDPETGIPIAVMDCAWITAMRTGASVGISAKYLAREDSRGRHRRLRRPGPLQPDGPGGDPAAVREVRCYDLYPEADEEVYRRDVAPFRHLTYVDLRDAPARWRRGADVVVTAIPIVSSPARRWTPAMLKAGGLAVSLDYDSAWTRRQ